MKSEHRIQSEIMLALSQHGCTVIRTNAGRVKTDDGRTVALAPKGWPDISGFKKADGRMILIEVKNERGRLRPEQIKFKNFIEQYPVLYGVCRSADEAIAIVRNESKLLEDKR